MELRLWDNSLRKAIYTPKPVYRPEWAKQGLTGKGIVLVTIDQQTGKVTGARMLQSTGNKQLDGAALEAYSQWRFQPGSVPQVKIPIEFASRPKPPAPKRTTPDANSLPVIDSAWFWCGSNCNADEKEKREVVAPCRGQTGRVFVTPSIMRFAVLLSVCVSLTTTSLSDGGE
jgi:TonB family protein